MSILTEVFLDILSSRQTGGCPTQLHPNYFHVTIQSPLNLILQFMTEVDMKYVVRAHMDNSYFHLNCVSACTQ